ncbi:MAG: HAD family hydrolase [Candidatus Woesearchaeota archaeon]|nr:HAD family hydrolase [Candidatus Woesearchaeota archaeon]
MTIDFSKIKTLIVDMDNTLCDTFHTLSKPQWGKVEEALEAKGWGAYAALLKENFGKHGFKHTLEHSDMSEEQIKYALSVYEKVDVAPLELFADAHDILDVDIPKILLSRGEPTHQQNKIEHLDLAQYFEKIRIVDTFHTKTDAIKEIIGDSDPKAFLIIGDRIEEEIADGKLLGIPTVLVRRPDWPVAESDVVPDMVVSSLKSVKEKLKL